MNATKGKPSSIGEIQMLYNEILIGATNYKDAGKKYGVSDNAVRKRFKTLGRELPQKNHPQIEFECSHCSNKFMREYNSKKDSRHGFHYCNKQCKDAGYKKQRHAINDCNRK